jgi:hypothetical protein
VGETADLSTPTATLQALQKSVPDYLDRVDRGDLIYPACKRTPEGVDGDVRAIWEHTRLEAMRYIIMVPGRNDEWLIDPARQPEMLDAFLRKPPHEDTVIDFTGVAKEDFVIAVIAGLNWLIHCAVLAGVDRKKFSRGPEQFQEDHGDRAAMVGARGFGAPLSGDAGAGPKASADAVSGLARIHSPGKRDRRGGDL